MSAVLTAENVTIALQMQARFTTSPNFFPKHTISQLWKKMVKLGANVMVKIAPH